MSPPPDTNLIDRLREEVERSIQRNVKGWETLTTPGQAGGVSERSLAAKRGTMNLFHYHPKTDEIYRTPLLFVTATSHSAAMFDLLPGQSMIEFLLDHGFDVYVLEWTAPAYDERRLKFEDYVLDFIPACVRAIQARSGEPEVTLVGYCMGGVLSLIYAALNSEGPLRNLVCLTTPFNFSHFGAWNIWADTRYFDVDQLVDTLGNFPPELFVASVDLLRPVSRITGAVQLWDNLWNDEYVKSKRAIDKWAGDTLPLPGEYFRQAAKELMSGNKLYKGELKMDGRTVDVGDIRVPFLNVLAEHDHIVPYAVARELVERVGSADKDEIVLKGGHVSVVAGGGALKRLWPRLDQWLAPRSA